MSDFFGFNTVLPGRPGASRPSFNPQEQQELERRVQEYAIETGEDFEIYDYAGTDFDFATNTRQIAPALRKEEELYVRHNERVDEVPRRTSFASLWENDGSHQQESPVKGLPEQLNWKGWSRGSESNLAEIEAQLMRTAGTQRRMMSVAEVEATLMNINGGRPILSEAMIAEQEAKRVLLEERRAEREAKQADMASGYVYAQYNGLMAQSDKDFINRIQISQLVTDDPFADDFYCQVYTAIRNKHMQQMGIPGNMSDSGSNEGRRKGNGRTEQRMQQQVQRIVNDAKRNPKRTNVAVEGALGKIAVNSVLNPRQLLQVSSKRSSTNDVSAGNSPKPSSPPGPVTTKSHTVLRWIENVYTHVLALEQMRRYPPRPPRAGEEDSAKDDIQRWNEEYGVLARKMWNELRITVPIGVVHPHPFISILNYSKGKKVIPRVLRHLLPEQTLTLLTMLVANFESLNVCKAEVHNDIQGNQEIELFMNTLVPPLLGFVSEAPFRIVVGLLALFIERNNMVWVARSKPGLSFLTLFLSRAEMLKQGQGNYPIPDAREIQQWDELYNRLFGQLQSHFSALFMPNATIADDVHVWRFLAAMAVGASVEQQHILVTEVREQVLENVIAAQKTRQAPEKAVQRIRNVNLFLHALGLDASQVAVPTM
ncbi:hypothetical protein BGX31_006613 [Mortierella sp. GBA43]|nr:hypothetical protein BGX31_006613 [Mortierella sp. GBA43]